MWAWLDEAWVNSAATNGLYLRARTCFITSTSTGLASQASTDAPTAERRWKPRNLSWGVVLVGVQKNEQVERRT